MPQPTDHSFDLKHRLIGAAVLIIVAAIVLPSVLTGQKQDYRRASINNGEVVVPIQQTFISRIEAGKRDVSAQQSLAEADKDKSEAGKESNTQGPTMDVNLVGLPSGWVVRVGVFQIPENAKKRRSLLDENGFNVNLEETKLNGKTAIRVFLGPFSTEEEAERMKARAVMVTNDKAFVARYP